MENDKINPKHYFHGEIECIDAVEACVDGLNGSIAFCIGNVIKYLWRLDRKAGESPLDNAKKAKWYLERVIKELERN